MVKSVLDLALKFEKEQVIAKRVCLVSLKTLSYLKCNWDDSINIFTHLTSKRSGLGFVT